MATKIVRIPCEVCGWIGSHLPDDQFNSEIDLIGFCNLNAPVNAPDESAPRWMCQSCYDGIQAINPDATPLMFVNGQEAR
jgi:hypothetical protein